MPPFRLTRRGLLRAALGGAAAAAVVPGIAPRVWAKTYPTLGTFPVGVEGKSVFAAAVVPLTGPYAAMGHDEQRGFELAIEHLNNGSKFTEAIPSLKKGGGVLGKHVEYASAVASARRPSPERTGRSKTRRKQTLRCVQSLDETAPFEVIDYRWIGKACSTDLALNRSEKISTWLTSNNGT